MIEVGNTNTVPAMVEDALQGLLYLFSAQIFIYMVILLDLQ